MAKTIPIEQQLDALRSVRADPTSAASKADLARSLSHKSNLMVARAAAIVTETHQADFLPAMAAAFDRFFIANSDKGCLAKTVLATGLYELGHNDAAVFLRGVRHIQMEPSFGKSVDAAAELRGTCALGLARLGYPDVLLVLAELLADPEPQPRMIAARAVAYTGSEQGAPLLRLKVLTHDSEPDVTAECLIALMKLSPKKSLPFVGQFLKSTDVAMVEAAAQAIGGSRTPAAFEFLRTEWESHLRPEPRRPLLLAMAMTCQPAAIDFLLQRIVNDRPEPAADALAALGMYRHDSSIRDRATQAVSLVGDPAVARAFTKAFGE